MESVVTVTILSCYYSFRHPDSPAPGGQTSHNPTSRVVHLHHGLGRGDVHVDHVKVDHGRGGPAGGHHVTGNVAIRAVALTGCQRLEISVWIERENVIWSP